MAEFNRTIDRYLLLASSMPIQQIPRRNPFAGIDRSAAPMRFTYGVPAADTQQLAGVRMESAWLDEASDWLREFPPAEVPRAPEPKTQVNIARAGLAKLDAEEARLAERTKHLGAPPPQDREPRVGSAPIWAARAPGRFNNCSCEQCESGRNWNAWANRTNQPLSPSVEDPRIRQRAERGQDAGL